MSPIAISTGSVAQNSIVLHPMSSAPRPSRAGSAPPASSGSSSKASPSPPRVLLFAVCAQLARPPPDMSGVTTIFTSASASLSDRGARRCHGSLTETNGHRIVPARLCAAFTIGRSDTHSASDAHITPRRRHRIMIRITDGASLLGMRSQTLRIHTPRLPPRSSSMSLTPLAVRRAYMNTTRTPI